MPHCAKLGCTIRTVVAPLSLSLVLHGLLFASLWCWPTRMRSPTLTVASTHLSLDTCVLESPSPSLLPGDELPADLRGPNVDVTLPPRLEGPSPSSTRYPVPDPVPGSSIGNGNGNGNGKNLQGSLFPLPATAGSVVYVLDRSISMGMDRKLDFARRELIESLQRLPPRVRFQVIAYNEAAELLLVNGSSGLLPAERAIIQRASAHLQTVAAAGYTNHLAALRRGVDLRPDVLFFLTDAADLKPEDVACITQRNHGSVIHTIEITRRRAAQLDGPLVQLARYNHGTYRCISIPILEKPVAGAWGW